MHSPAYLKLVFSWLEKKCVKFENFIETEQQGEARCTSTQVRPLQQNVLNFERSTAV